MKSKYSCISLYATQGGGVAVRDGSHYVFHEVPDWGNYRPGDLVPDEWGIQYMHKLYTLLETDPVVVESRARREGSYKKRHSYWNRKHKVNRKIKKKAILSYAGTLRSITKERINAIMHRVGVDMAKEERQKKRKLGIPINFMQHDELRVVNVDDCDEGLRLGDICIMQDVRAHGDFIIVKIRRNNKLKQLEKNRFILHKRFVYGE